MSGNPLQLAPGAQVLLLDLNPVVEPDSVYPLGPAILAELASREGAAVVCRSWTDLRTQGGVGEVLSGARWDLIGASVRNIDNTRGLDTCYYLPAVLPVLELLACEYGDRLVVGGSGFSLVANELTAMLPPFLAVTGPGVDTWSRLFAAGPSSGVVATETSRGDASAAGCKSEGTAREASTGGSGGELGPLPTRRWFSETNKHWDRVGFDTQAGCGQRCVYCTYPSLAGKRRDRRSADEILAFVDMWRRDIDVFDVVDDVFNADLDHAVTLCSAWARSGRPFAWRCYARPNGVSRSYSELLAGAGCVEAVMGVDSLSQDVLGELRKGFTVDQVAEATSHLKAAGIMVSHSLLLGTEFEIRRTVLETLANLKTIAPDRVSVQYGARIYRGSTLGARLVRRTGQSAESLLRPRFSVSDELSLEQVRELFEAGAASMAKRPVA